jgi:hypothetical protein
MVFMVEPPHPLPVSAPPSPTPSQTRSAMSRFQGSPQSVSVTGPQHGRKRSKPTAAGRRHPAPHSHSLTLTPSISRSTSAPPTCPSRLTPPTCAHPAGAKLTPHTRHTHQPLHKSRSRRPSQSCPLGAVRLASFDSYPPLPPPLHRPSPPGPATSHASLPSANCSHAPFLFRRRLSPAAQKRRGRGGSRAVVRWGTCLGGGAAQLAVVVGSGADDQQLPQPPPPHAAPLTHQTSERVALIVSRECGAAARQPKLPLADDGGDSGRHRAAQSSHGLRMGTRGAGGADVAAEADSAAPIGAPRRLGAAQPRVSAGLVRPGSAGLSGPCPGPCKVRPGGVRITGPGPLSRRTSCIPAFSST